MRGRNVWVYHTDGKWKEGVVRSLEGSRVVTVDVGGQMKRVSRDWVKSRN